MRRGKYSREGRQIERCHEHEQMAEKRVGEGERARERQADRAREKSGSG